MTCDCKRPRTLDKLLMDYILFGDPTAAAEIVERAEELRNR